ncbi:MAG: DUF805 domain-containing protein [Pseudomonadales bacterium]|jgi:uncharacterized membrane protein YhaH (DUF805 family)|nr:DUF805 domain-containing protein [Pseudomonadales bacterium]
MDWFTTVMTQRYARFTGRAQRAEYWYFYLFVTLIYLVTTLIDVLLGLFSLELGIGPVGALASIALAVPSISVTVRRLHDTDRSGWWMLILLLPLIGAIVLVVFTVQAGTAGTNRYGPDPLGTPP